MASRLEVRKTYKLYIGGAFPRSESGRTFEVTDLKGRFLANAALASRKDARDAVVAARKAFGGWSSATAYNRGQVLYRVAEVAPWLAAHMDVNAIDLAGVDDRALRTELEVAAADNVKRVRRPDTTDWYSDPGLGRLRSFLETTTVWHPIGV